MGNKEEHKGEAEEKKRATAATTFIPPLVPLPLRTTTLKTELAKRQKREERPTGKIEVGASAQGRRRKLQQPLLVAVLPLVPSPPPPPLL